MSVYSQSTQMVSQQRHAGRWGAVPGRSRKRGGGSQEQVRLTQLAICLALFLSIFLWKGIFPQKLTQVREDLLNMITTDLDFQGALTELGESLAESESMLSDLGMFCVEVFGGGQERETLEKTDFIPPPISNNVLDEELRFLSQGVTAEVCSAHYADLERYGLRLVTPIQPPVLDENLPAATEVPEEPAVIPAAGTVVMFSNYSGEALPSNYTMDQLSLGELETITPVIGHLNSEYGYRDHPIDGRYQFHGGVDIGGQNGDPIGAFAAGTVEYIGEDDSYGQYLQIDHGNGVKSFYAHCSKIVVSKGQRVVLGEKVAEIGSSGSATGPHLHLELKFNKMHLNPVYYVDFLEQ